MVNGKTVFYADYLIAKKYLPEWCKEKHVTNVNDYVKAVAPDFNYDNMNTMHPKKALSLVSYWISEYLPYTDNLYEEFQSAYLLAGATKQDFSDISALLFKYIEYAECEYSVRSDWQSALRSVKKGNELSTKIGYALSNKDLFVLGRLYKRGWYRRKIEDLLQDCNFHHVCGLLASQLYDIYFAELQS